MRLLVLEHKSEYFNDLLDHLTKRKVIFDVKKPMEEINLNLYDGIIASGGALPREKYKEMLNWYKDFLLKTNKPFLGICLGLRILGFCHNARMRKIPLEEGNRSVEFFKNYPLAPNIKNMDVFQSHEFDLIEPLPPTLENFAKSKTSQVEAVKVKNKRQFGVQFHPEKSDEGKVILDSFVEMCSR